MKVFIEIQRFNQWWIRLLMMAVVAIVVGTTIMAYPGEHKDEAPFWISLVTSIFMIFLIIILFFWLKLETKIDEQGIYYKFQPFKTQQISWSEIEKCMVRQYSPIREYGGWGYRMGLFSKNGSAVNIKGNIGIQIVFKSGKQLLIGTQKKEDAEKVLEKYNHKIKSNEN